MTPILGIMASQISGHLGYPAVLAYDSIATASISGSSSIVQFSSIPGTYAHLQLRFMWKGSSTSGGYPTAVNIQFNSDTTAANYHGSRVQGNGSAGISGGYSNNNESDSLMELSSDAASGVPANAYSVGIADFLDYSNTNKYKSMRIFQGADSGSITNQRATVLANTTWLNTSAITNIKLTFDATYGGNILASSKVALYGIKAAV